MESLGVLCLCLIVPAQIFPFLSVQCPDRKGNWTNAIRSSLYYSSPSSSHSLTYKLWAGRSRIRLFIGIGLIWPLFIPPLHPFFPSLLIPRSHLIPCIIKLSRRACPTQSCCCVLCVRARRPFPFVAHLLTESVVIQVRATSKGEHDA